ncbi:hypothetical protein CHS0354_009486 [Potamilus streckersoni]|uniref:G-protein coupled receptors family 1 profile domain-containing protein n=1 Tax=Potamilus streckersoni TaxID=2493646 RepID=A0AAE0VKT9_9BIVA|nr:hypothetical protein CHS0354_009486 [Potamilus streckersoni]
MSHKYSISDTENVTQLFNLPENYVLWILNEKFYRRYIPVLIYISVNIVVGIIGNGLVVSVFYFQMRRSSANIFIMWLATADLCMCLFGMPFELFDLRFPLMYGDSIPCKAFRYIEFTLAALSCTILVSVAIDRYFAIRNPLKKFSRKKAKVIVGIDIGISLLIAIPAAFVFGEKLVPTSTPGIYGRDCSYADAIKETKFALAFHIYLFVILILFSIILIGIYVSLGREIFHWRRSFIGELVVWKGKLSENSGEDSSESCSMIQSRNNSKKNFSSETKNEKQDVYENILLQIVREVDANTSNGIDSEIRKNDATFSDHVTKYDTLSPELNNLQNQVDLPQMQEGTVNEAYTGTISKNEVHNDQSHSGLILSEIKIKDSNCELRDENAANTSSESVIYSKAKTVKDSTNEAMGNKRQNSNRSMSGLTELPVHDYSKCADVTKRSMKKVRMQRMTFIFLVVTAVFILSYLPYVCVELISVLGIYVDENSSLAVVGVLEILRKTPYINNVANPFIYALFTPEFRKGCIQLFWPDRKLKRKLSLSKASNV